MLSVPMKVKRGLRMELPWQGAQDLGSYHGGRPELGPCLGSLGGFNGGCNTGAQGRVVFISGARVYALPGEGEDTLAPPSG